MSEEPKNPAFEKALEDLLGPEVKKVMDSKPQSCGFDCCPDRDCECEDCGACD